MATAKWTLMGMYNYDNTIFNEMILPMQIFSDLLFLLKRVNLKYCFLILIL